MADNKKNIPDAGKADEPPKPGKVVYGNVTIPFVDRFPKGEIYNLLTTRPEDMAHERKDE